MRKFLQRSGMLLVVFAIAWMAAPAQKGNGPKKPPPKDPPPVVTPQPKPPPTPAPTPRRP